MRDRAGGRRRVAGEHLQLNALVDEEGDGFGRVGAEALGEYDEAERLHVAGEGRL